MNMNKKTYQVPQATLEMYGPMLLAVNPASGDGDYHDGMDVDARRRDDSDAEKQADTWGEGLW